MKIFIVKYVLNGLNKMCIVCVQNAHCVCSKRLYSAVILGFSPCWASDAEGARDLSAGELESIIKHLFNLGQQQ